MHSLLVPSLTLGGLIPAVRAIAYPGPAVTHVDRILEGVFPNPTPAPAIDISELRRRQNDAGDNTCGWQDNGLALTCGVSRTCMKYLPDNSVGMAGCCTAGDYQDCGWSNQCLNSWDAQESCGSACYSNTFIRKCTASSAPFCVSWTYPFEQIQDYGCSDEPIDSWITISASSSGASSGRVSLPVAPESSVTGWRSEDNPSSQCSSSSSCGTPTPPPSPDDDDDTPVGAIVGGVVGGIGAIALVCLGVWLCLRHKKKQPTATAAVSAVWTARVRGSRVERSLVVASFRRGGNGFVSPLKRFLDNKPSEI
ncbi:hypothetical protein BDY21DRAFT_25319 [Lineolata rhizophorae]|uniref:Mid2 domain-containing protein n=1 Tax=Lineolata rhizophorae TaxID=578093 RepID=A0A6A6P0S6_9PEZI|nr:hypothetical protein BDY21DRAFT_25319 [Lineolata rhizophorae]